MAIQNRSFSQLLEALNLRPKSPASPKIISEFERKMGIALPPDVRSVYEQSNGLVLKENALEILSLNASWSWIEAFTREGVSRVFGYFPFVDDFNSNPFCVCCSSPLMEHVVRIFHDDAAELMFRSIDGFFRWVLSFGSEDWLVLEKPGEFANAGRTKKDLATAKKLQKLAESLTGNEQVDARRLALTLCSEEALDDIIPQLEAEDVYVREAAERRLRDLADPKARAALNEYQRKQRQFAKKCVAVLDKVGISAEYDERHPGWWPVLKVQAGQKTGCLNFPAFYDRRNTNDVWNLLVDRAKKALKR